MRSEFELMTEERRNVALKLNLGEWVYGYKCSISTHPAKYHRARDPSRNQTMTQATSSFEKTAESVFRM